MKTREERRDLAKRLERLRTYKRQPIGFGSLAGIGEITHLKNGRFKIDVELSDGDMLGSIIKADSEMQITALWSEWLCLAKCIAANNFGDHIVSEWEPMEGRKIFSHGSIGLQGRMVVNFEFSNIDECVATNG